MKAFLPKLCPWFAFVLALALLACGGGGGASAPSFTITLDRSSVALTTTEGLMPSSVHLRATGTGTPPGSIYIGAIVEGVGIDPVIPVAISGMTADLTLTAASGLAAGTYTGRVLLIAATDPAGTNKVGGTPIAIPYTVTVLPGLSIAPASINATAVSGETGRVDLAIQLPGGVSSFTSRVDLGGSWLNLGTPVGTSLPVTLGPCRSGSYTGSLAITAGGQTRSVPVSFTVSLPPGGEQELAVAPGSLTFSSTEGLGAAAKALSVSLPSWAPTAPLQVAVQYGTGSSGWLSAERTAGGLDVTASAATLGQGTHTATLHLSVSGSAVSVPVSFTVGAGLVVAPGSLDFHAIEYGDASPQTVTFSQMNWPTPNALGVTVEYSGAGTGWLTASLTASGLEVAASAALLSQGTYHGTVLLTPPSPGTVVRVPVTLTVGAGLLTPGPRSLRVDGDSMASTLGVSETIQLAGDGPLVNWTATSDTPWLRLTRSAGATGSELTYGVDVATLPALSNFSDQTGAISVQVPGTSITPITLQVTLRKALPEVSFLGPYLVVAGRESRIILRGRGFYGVQDLAARLSVPGLVPNAVTVLSDTEAACFVTPTAAGTVPVSVGNALGMAANAAMLQVVEPQTYTYAAIPTGGNKRSVLYDAQRKALYAVDVDGEALMRFRYQDASWVVDAASVPAILDAGLAPDGGSLVVTATPGHLRLLDPDTLATQFSLDHAAGFARNFTYLSEGILPMNNGRSWLPTGNGGWNELAYFDHRTRTIKPRESQPNLSTSFYGGPWTVVPRDGSRMLVGQSASISPTPPMLVLNASDSLLQEVPGLSGNSYNLSFSDRGERLMVGFYEVRDQDWGLVGRATLPDMAYFPVAQALSPDGRRAYLLAYRGDAMNDWPTSALPRVFVFDTSAALGADTDLPCLGQFDLADYPTCRTTACSYRPRSAISPDGGTLFFVGSVNLVVVPIPAGFR